MNEPPPIKPPPPDPEADASRDSERTKQVTVAGWTAGVSAFFALLAVGQTNTWSAAFGVAAVMAMVGGVCFLMLKRER